MASVSNIGPTQHQLNQTSSQSHKSSMFLRRSENASKSRAVASNPASGLRGKSLPKLPEWKLSLAASYRRTVDVVIKLCRRLHKFVVNGWHALIAGLSKSSSASDQLLAKDKSLNSAVKQASGVRSCVDENPALVQSKSSAPADDTSCQNLLTTPILNHSPAISLPKPGPLKKIDVNSLPRELWNQVLSYDLSIKDLCALRAHPSFGDDVTKERRDLLNATSAGALNSFLMQSLKADPTDAMSLDAGGELAMIARSGVVKIDLAKLKQVFGERESYVAQLGVCLDAVTTIKAIELSDVNCNSKIIEPHPARQVVLDKLANLAELRSLFFCDGYFEVTQLNSLSMGLKSQCQLRHFAISAKSPRNSSDVQVYNPAFDLLINSLKKHVKLRALKIEFSGIVSVSTINALNNLVRSLPQLVEFQLHTRQIDNLPYFEDIRPGVVKLAKNFNRWEKLNSSSFRFCRGKRSRHDLRNDPYLPVASMLELAAPRREMSMLVVRRFDRGATGKYRFNELIKELAVCHKLKGLIVCDYLANEDEFDRLLNVLSVLPDFRKLSILKNNCPKSVIKKLQNWQNEAPDLRSFTFM